MKITKEILNYPARGKNLGKLRTAKLASLLKQGGDEATTAARSMMDKMVKNGVADTASVQLDAQIVHEQ